MVLTVSQVLAAHPEAMTDAANGVGSQLAAVDQQVGDARGALDRIGSAWAGAAADSARSHGSAIVTDHSKYGETLRTLRQALSSGAQRMTSIRSNLERSVQSATSVGWQIGDDGQATPGPLLQKLATFSPVTGMQVRLMGLGVTSTIQSELAQFQAADQTTAEAIRKLAGDNGAPPPSAPAPQVPAPTPGGQNPADIAKGFLGRNASELKKSGELPMDPTVPSDVCCANFVTAILQKAGLIDWHSNGVADMANKLRAQGWHPVPASEAKPGDVAVINGNEHTELVSSNNNGVVTLIGSNNVNADGTQQVSYGTPSGSVVYLTPP